MINVTQIRVPSLVRIKPGALPRLGLYLARENLEQVLVLASPLPVPVALQARSGLEAQGITAEWLQVDDNSFENAVRLFAAMPRNASAIVGIGGGKALDTAKYVAFLARRPYLAVPTSLSNDGFCSPQSSLTLDGKRRSLPAQLPRGVILDVDVCLGAPKNLWLSGVGDLVSKLTAVTDWKLAFHHNGEPVDDLAALLSDATVYQFLAAPAFDAAGAALLGTALMLNGIAMEICGSSRPASGGEHLISHALDAISARPRLHGLQVGVASYIVSRLQNKQPQTIDTLFQRTGFWQAVADDPFSKREWLEAARLAPGIKDNFYTVLSSRDCLPEIADMIENDPALRNCFVE
ncbi:MAG: iron-containing alcohol dehydrogenase family protein [Desulfovibrio sp.]|jgi:glycerol-1-phosphate dehydrogenase [NAD(P)+]|nr:iron-containing alcohol dehydrogenase family protein [Desulfovibrio sp.]